MMARMRRVVRIVSVALVTAGIVLLAEVAVTLLWKEPLSAIYAEIRQNQAANQLDEIRSGFFGDPDVATAATSDAEDEQRAKRLAELFAAQAQNGKPIGRILVPSIDADYVLIQGTDEADLKLGPGHYPESAFPGQGRTVAVAGHRTTYGAPFNRIDSIDVGDTISLQMPYGRFTYEVGKTRIVDPDQTGIVRDIGRERLVLTSCHPLYSAAQRYAVLADLKRFELARP